MNQHGIPRIDISALFGTDTMKRDGVDRAIHTAARQDGMMVVTGLPEWAVLDAGKRRQLLSLFGLPEAEIRKLWRWNFDPARPNVYRGWFPLQPGLVTYKEGIDMGPDVAYGAGVIDGSDPLCEATPFPPEDVLPAWREVARDYYLAMTRLSFELMRSVARGLGLAQDSFDAAFDGGISTLRLLHYPVRPASSFEGVAPADVWTTHDGTARYVLGRGHVDTGFMTLLAQDGVGGLQAQHLDGSWIDVPPEEGTLAVNFGKVLELWSAGAIRATVHRVLGAGQERYSVPFFYEARPDAVVAPLPLPGAVPFEPFYFGDHLWETATKFVEQRGIAHLRTPRGRPPGVRSLAASVFGSACAPHSPDGVGGAPGADHDGERKCEVRAGDTGVLGRYPQPQQGQHQQKRGAEHGPLEGPARQAVQVQDHAGAEPPHKQGVQDGQKVL